MLAKTAIRTAAGVYLAALTTIASAQEMPTQIIVGLSNAATTVSRDHPQVPVRPAGAPAPLRTLIAASAIDTKTASPGHAAFPGSRP
jgi:hypothetical protein